MKGLRRRKGVRLIRRTFGLDPDTDKRLRARAKMHGVSQAEMVRSLINGHRPGASPGSPVALADSWWDSRKPDRRVSIHRNHASPKDSEHEDRDQLTIFTEGDDL